MGEIVIMAYRPKPGCDEALLRLTHDHVPLLRGLGLVTDRPPVVMRAGDGTIVEVFEWYDGGIAKAHEAPEVLSLWERYDEVCEYIPLAELEETSGRFAQFTPVSFNGYASHDDAREI